MREADETRELNGAGAKEGQQGKRLGSHTGAVELVPYDEAMTWRQEMELRETMFSAGLEIYVGRHPAEGDIAIVTGPISNESVCVLRC
jgi:hypothetical protein